MAEIPQDLIGDAIKTASEQAFRAAERVSRLIPVPIGQAVADAPRLTLEDVKRLTER